MPDLRLVLEAPASLPLDEALVAIISLEAGSASVTVSSRLNLVEGDLTVVVSSAAGTTTCRWPWPVDAMARFVELAAGHRLVAAIPLVATDTSAPAFPAPGTYTVTASFEAAPGRTVTSDAVAVRRTAAVSAARSSMLADRDVLQSLLSASILGDAAHALAALEQAGTPVTRALAAIALDHVPRRGAAMAQDEFDGLVMAMSAVLPPGYGDGDPRRAVLDALVSAGSLDAALLRGEAVPV